MKRLFKREMIAAALLCAAASFVSAEKSAAAAAQTAAMPEQVSATAQAPASAAATAAAQPVVLTVEQAVDCANKNSRTLKSAQIDLEMKRRAGDNSWNTLLPSVQATGSMSRSNKYSNTYSSIIEAINPAYVEPDVTESMHWTAVGNVTASLNLSLAQIQAIRAARA